MKKALAVAALLLAGAASASDKYLCSISASTTSANSSATGACAVSAGAKVSAQCDAAAYVSEVSTASAVVTTTTGVKVAADALFDIDLKGKYWAVITSTGTATCRFFLVLDR